MTRWLDYISTFGHLHQRKFSIWHTKFAKIVPKFCQIINKASKIAQDFEDIAKVAKFCQIWSHWGPHFAHHEDRNRCLSIPTYMVKLSEFITSVSQNGHFINLILSQISRYFGPWNVGLRWLMNRQWGFRKKAIHTMCGFGVWWTAARRGIFPHYSCTVRHVNKLWICVATNANH